LDNRIITAALAFVVVFILANGYLNPSPEILSAKNGGLVLVVNPPVGMSSERLASNIEHGHYSSSDNVMGWDDYHGRWIGTDEVQLGFPVFSYEVYENIGSYKDTARPPAVAKGGKAKISFKEAKYPPLVRTDKSIFITTECNITIVKA
jgi:hypothetical protein